MKYIRTKPYASTFFKSNGGPSTMMSALPRNRYMFYVNFVASAAANARYPEFKDLGSWERGISFKIHSVDKPKVEMNTTELNQYNRRRHVYTKVEYQPFTVKIYDTVDDKPLKLWQRYFTYYFADSRPKSTNTYKSYVVGSQLDTPESTGYGFNPEFEDYNFFDRVELYAIFGKRYTQINYINPKIINVDWQNYDSQSTDMSEATMTLKYESIEFPAFGQRIPRSLMSQLGFDITNPLEVPGLPAPIDDIDSWNPNDNIGIISGRPNPLSPIQSILNVFQVANSTLNLFSQLPLGAFSQRAGEILGQTTQIVSAGNSLNSLLSGQTPVVPSGFLGVNVAGPVWAASRVGGVLKQFGSFNFGS